MWSNSIHVLKELKWIVDCVKLDWFWLSILFRKFKKAHDNWEELFLEFLNNVIEWIYSNWQDMILVAEWIETKEFFDIISSRFKEINFYQL
jgi:hypothetical protein